jgi:predicted nucleic acid-binding protein
MNLVLDASVVIKWYIYEDLLEPALRLKEKIRDGTTSVAVPRFFFVETANVLWKRVILRKDDLKRSDAKGIFSRILDLPLHVLEDDEILLRALDLSMDHALSIYDGMYLASALRFKATLITADAVLVKRLAGSAMAHHIKYLGDL